MMTWTVIIVIILIAIVGYAVVGAINNNSATNLKIEAQRRQDMLEERNRLEDEKREAKENSPEYKMQKSINAYYAHYLFQKNLWTTLLLEAEIRYYSFPESEERVDETGKKVVITKHKLQQDNKDHIESMRETLQQNEAEWEGGKKNHKGYNPDAIEKVMNEQGFRDEVTFLTGYESYVWELNRIKRLNKDLSGLKKGVDVTADHYKEVLDYIRTKMKSGDRLYSSKIMTTFFFNSTEAWRISKDLEDKGILASDNGINRQVV